MGIDIDFEYYKNRYTEELLDSVIPFWTKHGIDTNAGGIFTCISDEGKIESHDKYLWSQLRSLWTFSALCRFVELRSEWLTIAAKTFEFVKMHGRDESGRWVYCVDRNGKVLQGSTSIFTDGFAILGLVEFARVSGSSEAISLAVETYENVRKCLKSGDFGIDPYPPLDGAKAHAVSMIFSLAFYELGNLTGDQEIVEAGLAHKTAVMTVFRQPERQLLFEYVDSSNRVMDSPKGRAVCPGHAIESMWFILHILKSETPNDTSQINDAVETIRWHLEAGWDSEFGGIYLGLDAANGNPWWPHSTAKIWWPHCEALYACLLSYELTGNDWCIDWFKRVDAYAFKSFPVPEYGEWSQRLNRKGERLTKTIALPVKDPFHLPRALIFSMGILNRLASK